MYQNCEIESRIPPNQKKNQESCRPSHSCSLAIKTVEPKPRRLHTTYCTTANFCWSNSEEEVSHLQWL